MKTLQLTLKLLRCSVRWHAAAAAYNCSEFMTWKFGWSSTREPDYPYQWRAAPLHDITIFFDKGKQLILSKWTNHKSAFPGKSSLSSREQDRQGDDTKTLCLFHFPFLWGILEVLVKLYCNGVMIQVSTWCFSTALLCLPCGQSLDSSPVLLTWYPLTAISEAVLKTCAVITSLPFFFLLSLLLIIPYAFSHFTLCSCFCLLICFFLSI